MSEQTLPQAMLTGSYSQAKADLGTNMLKALPVWLSTIAWALLSAAIADHCQLIRDGQGIVTGYGEALYFTIMNMTTVGFGEIVPDGWGGQVLASINALVGMIFMGVIIAIAAAAFMPPFGAKASGNANDGEDGTGNEQSGAATASGSSNDIEEQAPDAEALKTLATSLRHFASVLEGTASGHEHFSAVRILRSKEPGAEFTIHLSPGEMKKLPESGKR